MQIIGQNFYRLQAETQPKKCFKPDKGSGKRPPPPYNFFSKILCIKQFGMKCFKSQEIGVKINFCLKRFFLIFYMLVGKKWVMQLMAKMCDKKCYHFLLILQGNIKNGQKGNIVGLLPFFNQKKELINKCIFYIILYNIFIYNILY